MLEYRIEYKMMKMTMLSWFMQTKVYEIFDIVVRPDVVQILNKTKKTASNSQYIQESDPEGVNFCAKYTKIHSATLLFLQFFQLEVCKFFCILQCIQVYYVR